MLRGSVQKYTAKDNTVTWRWRIALPDPDTGKRTWSQWTFPTKRELEAFRTRKLAELAGGGTAGRTRKTVADLLTDWLTLEAPHSGITVTSLENYQHMVGKHLLPGVGSVAVESLTTERIERFYAGMLERGYARATVSLAHVCLRQALDRAVRHKLLSTNPAAVRLKVLSVRNRPGSTRRQMRTWTREECTAFLAVAPQSRYGPLWALLLGTGLRRGEGLGLRWGDVTLPANASALGTAHIRQSVEPLRRGGPIIMEPKNHKTRLVPLVPGLCRALAEHQPGVLARRDAAGDAWLEGDLLFPRPDGTPQDPDHVASDFYQLIQLAGVPRLTIHGLRHTFATLSIEAGVPIHVVSRWLGHSTISVTMNVYAHVTERLEERGADLLTALFSPPQTPPATALPEPLVHTVCASCPYAPLRAPLHQR